MTCAINIVVSYEDITPEGRDTPIANLVAFHNFGAPHDMYDSATLLVGMLMDRREHLLIPENFVDIFSADEGTCGIASSGCPLSLRSAEPPRSH